ncbi:MAG: VOC family protein [Burkholderiaceae bacterium]
MLANSPITTILPVRQIDRARHFYEDKLGLIAEGAHADGSFVMRSNGGGTVSLLPRPDHPKSQLTALSFEVADVDAEIRDLEQRGVRFEDYDLPGLKTVNHVFAAEGEKCAWFTDPEDNVLCIHQALAH